jgi:hypothetical protein
MADYRIEKTKELEERGLSLLKSIGFAIEANNIESNSIDYKIKKNKEDEKFGYFYIDFQYSADFSSYGDIRVDIISAYDINSLKLKSREIEEKLQTIISKSKSLSIENLQEAISAIVTVKKFGKLFDPELNSIIFFIFNKKDNEIKKGDIPDIIAIIPMVNIIKFIKKYPNLFAKRIKFNDKASLGDSHGSAFFTVPFAALYAIEPFFIIYPQDLKKTLLAT